MRVPLGWLREMVPVELPADELGELLSAKGMHVEAIERPWDGLDGVVVARVVEVRDHPGSDRLCVARVDTGSGEREIVAGIRNMGAGDLVPLAPPGARVPSLPEPLSARSLRGVVSDGMLCSAWELGISQDREGIMILTGVAPGTDLKAALGLDEAVLDLEIESNRPDLLSVAGVAREVAAAIGLPLTMPATDVDESDEAAAGAATVRVDDPLGCPRYLARVIRDLRVAPSPPQVQARLTAAGVRPVSNLVDATNYAMLELGQPMHAFDLERLAGGGIVVRGATAGEHMTTLDGVDRTLETGDLLICDLERPVGIAGVMGGADSEVSPATTTVLLESAYFDPAGVLRVSRRLGLPTEAAIRFSRGTDPEGVATAASRAARLMCEWSGSGRVLRGAIDEGLAPARRRLAVRPSRAGLLAGHPIEAAEIVEALAPLGIAASATADTVEVEVPGFRPDLRGEVELIEEVIRAQGYDRVGATVPRGNQVGSYDASFLVRASARERLVRAGLREALSLSFASKDELDLLGHSDAVRVANPPAADMPFLRTSLVPNLVRGIARSLRRGSPGAALFEIGHVFRLGDPVNEYEVVAAAVSGRVDTGLHADGRDFDALDAKGALETLLGSGWELGGEPGWPFHPARSRRVVVGGVDAGVLGELHPAAARAFDVPGRVGVFELDTSVLAGSLERFSFRDVPRFPPVRRDLAFVVPEAAAAGDVRVAIEEGAGPLLDRCVLFDLFVGDPLPPGTKSLAFAIDLRAPDRTLEAEEAERVVRGIVERVGADVGGVLRSG